MVPAKQRLRAGRNNFKFFSETMRTKSLHRLDLENEIRKALENEQFELHYQPKADAKTWSLVGAEALLRWDHPERGPRDVPSQIRRPQ